MSTYKYLGILFSSSGSYTQCKNDLYKRALKANFKLSKALDNVNPNVKTSMHLFDHTVKPVLLYASEIWVNHNKASGKINNQDFSIFQYFNELPCEKLHCKFLKRTLGVHKKACNDAVYGELGRFPIYFDCIISCIKYFTRLTQTAVSELLKNAYIENEQLNKSQKKGWLSNVIFILKQLKIPECQYSDKTLYVSVRKQLVSMFKIRFMEKLENAIEHKGKLRTYALFKKNFCQEPYLQVIKNENVRTCFTRFRISAHKLHIETGRYKKIDSDNRLCEICKSNEIEDEIHFITSCSAYATERENLYERFIIQNKNFKMLPNISKFIWLMSNENVENITLFSEFVFSCYTSRMEHEIN